eukprot:11212292-Lingulodinium_polyedra.AAC.1
MPQASSWPLVLISWSLRIQKFLVQDASGGSLFEDSMFRCLRRFLERVQQYGSRYYVGRLLFSSRRKRQPAKGIFAEQ